LSAQITVLDAGGQYCHLIARKVRDLGVYAEVAPSETPASELTGSRGLIISGGPSSVYDAGSPKLDRGTLHLPAPVLGICYGQQLMAHMLGGKVRKWDQGEYGFAQLDIQAEGRIFHGIEKLQQVWMSHRDQVAAVPEGFQVLGRTPTCEIAAMASLEHRQFAVQFHPEVVHTPCGTQILSNFVFGVCECQKDWNPAGQVDRLTDQIREAARGRKIFFFVSGGVDSTVAYSLCLKAVGPDKVHGTYVDTGLMREGETDFVRSSFASIGATAFDVEDAGAHFLDALQHAYEPEEKRNIIGEAFVDVQQRILDSGRFQNGDWVLGQGTIYPDTIESGGTAKADLIKTHHNRVAGIQKLIEEGNLVEPLAQFYKDEVRAVGKELGLSAELLDRHPFPGPGLAIRCLCSNESTAPERSAAGWVLPVRSVGVQGDSRTYRAALALRDFPKTDEETARLVNSSEGVNRVVVLLWSDGTVASLRSLPSRLTAERLARLRRVDHIVRRISLESGFDNEVWQFPVVLVPLGTSKRPDSVVLRPIHSVDGMTASVVRMPRELMNRMVAELKAVEGIAGIFYDLTNKPPGTIEWE
jgi:GMP synthase (glutamine-hydrolysing)